MRIDDLIEQKVCQALKNNGVLNPDDYDIGIMPAPHFMHPAAPAEDEMLYSALVFLAYRIPGREADRIEHHGQVKEPYWPQSAYDRIVSEILRKINAELGDLPDLGPELRNISSAGLYIS